jgi:hypothetical protein
MKPHRRPYIGAVIAFAIWTVLSYVVGLSSRAIELPARAIIVSIIVFALAGAVYGWLVWFLILRPHLAMWTKGAMLFPAIGFCFYILNHGMADTVELMATYCLPVGVIVGAIYGILANRIQQSYDNLKMERYVARNGD